MFLPSSAKDQSGTLKINKAKNHSIQMKNRKMRSPRMTSRIHRLLIVVMKKSLIIKIERAKVPKVKIHLEGASNKILSKDKDTSKSNEKLLVVQMFVRTSTLSKTTLTTS